ncbi:MAG TPA: nucleotide exchange factor GrpE [Thermoanaerobacterales bacterium]|nr:nucleotide exchange factor GrpE [Thermoanaerobacterales bacterium]
MNDEKHDQDENGNTLEVDTQIEAKEKEELHKLKQEIEIKTKESEKYYSMLQRLQADFENYKKRVEKERKDIIDYASADIIKQLLPIIDNLERAIESIRKQHQSGVFVEGIDMILSQILKLMENLGVKEIEAMHKEFDPYYHEAIMRIEGDEHPDNTVVDVLQKGYVMKSKVLRPSMVKVMINN